jgi:hypothetical protein
VTGITRDIALQQQRANAAGVWHNTAFGLWPSFRPAEVRDVKALFYVYDSTIVTNSTERLPEVD